MDHRASNGRSTSTYVQVALNGLKRKVRFFTRARKTVESQWFSERMEIMKHVLLGSALGAGIVFFLYLIHSYFVVVW